ncbi:PepSY domain-containing protein [Nitrososphaera sp.]|uniref:PepSY domain-containing protein n=1 Tax=Nitrososphaera sp. TaxID=1971748 RepID=UPI00307DA8C1
MTKLVSKKVLLPAALAATVALVVLAIPPAIAASSWQDAAAMGQMPKINGTVNAGQTMKDFLNSNLKVTLSQASDTAQKQVDGGKVVGGHLGVVQGYLVYTFKVINPDKETANMVIVDAGDGKVLFKSEDMSLGGFMGGGYGGLGHGRHSHWGNNGMFAQPPFWH